MVNGKRKIVDSVPVPAAMINGDHTVVASNEMLQRLLVKFNHDIVGLKIGAALNCGCAGPSGCQCGLAAVIDASNVMRRKLRAVPVLILYRSGAAALHKVTAARVGDDVLLMIRASEGGR
ncbi:MAG TPA: hypothetical protein VMM82_14730 [Spirochaetia bacterium]|nr:hypothetical protein [Spirochaetia bacterium]